MRIQAHVGLENKRKNLVGEGFEDAVAALLRRVRGISERHEIRSRLRGLRALEAKGEDFGYVLTNEFDPARLGRGMRHATPERPAVSLA